MDFHFNDFNNFSVQNASLSCRIPAPTNYLQNFYPHELCSYCSNPYHCFSNCPFWEQLSNSSYEPMNTNFSSLGLEINSNFYNPDWSNQSDFSWSAQATRNCAYQFDEVHHSNYLQFDHQAQPPAY
jgi:hypothetical protein